METEKPKFEGWAILELMGHRVLGGRVTQEEIFGRAMIRIDVPDVNDAGDAVGTYATQYYSPEAMYALTPTSEAVATRLACQRKPAPVTPWDLRLPEAASNDQPLELGDVDADYCNGCGGFLAECSC